jgi:SAM-dependent methyltransferase
MLTLSPGKQDFDIVNYEWINIDEIQNVAGLKIVMFGAGKGAEEFFHYLDEATFYPATEVAAIADNDASHWGKTLGGIPIIDPRSLLTKEFDKIVVTSVSGREAISSQLDKMGFAAGKDYILIGRYPSGYLDNFIRLLEIVPPESIKGRRCLHIGPGGFLGLEALLYSIGAEFVCSVDKFSFNVHYPEITKVASDYLRIKEDMILPAISNRIEHEIAMERFHRLFVSENGRMYLDQDKISYHYPMDACSLEFDDNQFDLVISFAVLEHVAEPESSIREMVRVLRKGGIGFHTIVTQDHRSFSKIDGYYPFSFREYSEEAWRRISMRKFYQNRLLPIEWKRLCQASGLIVERYDSGQELDLSPQVSSTFHSCFKRFSKKELSQINCMILGRKPF